MGPQFPCPAQRLEDRQPYRTALEPPRSCLSRKDSLSQDASQEALLAAPYTVISESSSSFKIRFGLDSALCNHPPGHPPCILSLLEHERRLLLFTMTRRRRAASSRARRHSDENIDYSTPCTLHCSQPVHMVYARTLDWRACERRWSFCELVLTFSRRQYGSGYPGVSGLGTSGRNFPFVFWPLVWGGGLGYGAAYLHNTNEVSDLQ